MVQIAHRRWNEDRPLWAERLGVSEAAVDLYFESDVIDGHLDSFIWTRLFGYDLKRRHGLGLFQGAFYSQLDFPRALEAGLTGGVWVITTNPFKPPILRQRSFFQNLAEIKALIADADELRHVRTAAEYRHARKDGKHGAFLGIQGGNALDRDLRDIAKIPFGDILRCTLVHLTNSDLGTTSSPLSKLRTLRGKDGLGPKGKDFVAALNEAKIFVDLAHIAPRSFDDAVDAHDKSQPLMVTHTGVNGVYPHWRNLSDAQIRTVADTGGIVGVMFQDSFLAPRGEATVATVVDHIEHIAKVAGEDAPALGSDFDGAITPPKDLPTPLELPRIVDEMLRRGWKDEAIRKVLGGNFLRCVEALRG